MVYAAYPQGDVQQFHQKPDSCYTMNDTDTKMARTDTNEN